MKAYTWDFEEALRQPEKLAREVLSTFLAGGIPAAAEQERLAALRAAGPGKYIEFEGRHYRAPRPGSREAFALAFLEELPGARAAIRSGEADWAARQSFLAALAFTLLLTELSETRERDGSRRGVAVKRDLSERDGAALARRFERLMAVHDEWTAADAHRQIARDVATGRLKLQRPRSATPGAVAKKIQRYLKPLR